MSGGKTDREGMIQRIRADWGEAGVFLVLFLTFGGGWGFIYNEKDNNWITRLVKFYPREHPNNEVFGFGRIFVDLEFDAFSQRV